MVQARHKAALPLGNLPWQAPGAGSAAVPAGRGSGRSALKGWGEQTWGPFGNETPKTVTLMSTGIVLGSQRQKGAWAALSSWPGCAQHLGGSPEGRWGEQEPHKNGRDPGYELVGGEQSPNIMEMDLFIEMVSGLTSVRAARV